MNFQSMDYIIAAASEKSFSKAAEKLSITQQTLSAHIASVEEELGCRLFIRHVPLEITYAGYEFLKYAESIQKQVKNLRRTFAEIACEEKGELRIGVTHTRGKIILLPVILAFREKHPGIELRIIENTNDILIQNLIKGDLDICISDFAESYPGIKEEYLYTERVVFAAEKKFFRSVYGDATDDVIKRIEQGEYSLLEQCPLLMSHEEHISGRYARRLVASFSTSPVIRAEAGNVDLLLSLCVNGVGGCLCPDIIIENSLTDKEYDSIYTISLGEKAEYSIHIGYKDEWSVISDFAAVCREVQGHIRDRHI